MKIALMVHDINDYGGHSLYTRILADALSVHHQVTVFANTAVQGPGSCWNFQPVWAWRSNALSSVYSFPIGMRFLAKALKDFQIRHAQGYCGDRPNIVTAHICNAAFLSSLQHISLRTRLSVQLMTLAEEKFYRRYRGPIIAVSQRIANDLKEFYGVRDNLHIIYHGVDTQRFNSFNREKFRGTVRRELGIRDDQTVALYVGSLIKTHHYLKLLTEKAHDIQFVFVSGARNYRWKEKNVHFLPYTTQIERYYAAADAFVFPTTYDSFGLVLFEAMASGLAVFSSDRAGAAELIHHGQDGFVIPLERWVDETCAGLHDPALLHSVGLAAQQTAQQHDWSKVVGEVEHIYQRVLRNIQ